MSKNTSNVQNYVMFGKNMEVDNSNKDLKICSRSKRVKFNNGSDFGGVLNKGAL